MKHIRFIAALALIILLFKPGPALAVCNGAFMDVLSAVSWESVFPIKIAGITIAGSNLEDSADLADSPVCACPIPSPPFIRLGIPVAFWEPSRLIETVKDPYCFPSLGMQLANPSPGTLAGGLSSSKGDGAPDASSFVQAHYFIFPVWSMLGLLADYACVEPEGFDVAYMTEIDPLWNSDILTAIIEPEAILFANPVAQLACMADAVAANK